MMILMLIELRWPWHCDVRIWDVRDSPDGRDIRGVQDDGDDWIVCDVRDALILWYDSSTERIMA
jgi:hypothetical protein